MAKNPEKTHIPKRKTSLPLWWQTKVFYQIYPLSFCDTNGDGLGDIKGLIEKLPYLAELGIGGVWLCPFYDAPLEYDYGYGPRDLKRIHPQLGTLRDFDRLVTEAHRLGIRIVMEWAVTNTSVQSRWFEESKSSRDNPKADWYLWSDEVPNNWTCYSGGSAWHYCPERNQYYLGMFFREHAELNWRHPEVKKAVYEAFEFWLKRGIDGYRIDTVYMYVKDRRLRDNPEVKMDPRWLLGNDDPILNSKYLDAVVPDVFRQKHIYDQNQPGSLAIMRDLRRICKRQGREILLLGEVDIASKTGLDLCRNGMSVGNNFALAASLWDAEVWAAVLTREQEAIDRFWCTNVFSNHDGTRGISRHATADPAETQARGRIMLAMNILIRGVPMLYYGEELGMLDADIPTRELKDPMSRRWHYLPGRSGLKRDVARSPMPWSAGRNAGFTSDRPWICLSADWKTRNVASQRRDPASTWHYTRRLIALRNTEPALQTGTFKLLEGRPAGCLAFERQLAGQRWLVAANFTPGELRLTVPAGCHLEPELGRSGERLSGEVRLVGYEVLVARIIPGATPEAK